MPNPRLLFLLAPVIFSAQAQDRIVYDDTLGVNVSNWSWASVNLANTTPVQIGIRSISMQPDAFQGLYFHIDNAPIQPTDHSALRFWVHGGTTGGQALRVVLQAGQTEVGSRPLNQLITEGGVAAGSWREAVWSFSGTNIPASAFDGIIVQDASGADQAAIYLDQVRLTAGAPPTTIQVTLDGAAPRRAIDPLIYGVSFGSDAQHAALRYPTRRWGGNRTSRYNWQFDVDNTANDYFFQNIAAGNGQNLPNNSSANAFIQATKAQGGEALITVPTLGWVAKDSRLKIWSFSQQTYGAQTLDECRFYAPNPPSWCSADSGNGLCSNGPNCQGGRIVGNNPLDTSKAAPSSYASEWITHLRARHGAADAGGVRFYALDNEPMLWNSTHRDVHPSAPTFADVWTRGRDRALAIKAVDANAKIFGPVTWGWCDYFTSAADAALGNCFNGPDRAANGGLPFVEWYLQRVCAEVVPGGARVVDYLDLHYYPQGAGIDGLNNDVSSGEQADVQTRRMRSLRELYDPNYTSESWIGSTENPKPALLRRARAAIAQHCPGTKLALTEYKWGPDNGITGAIAQAELLAIFGREGVDYAARWVAPIDGSLAEHAFRLFLNYDGNFSRVLGNAFPANNTAPDTLGSYAIEQPGGPLFVVLINRVSSARPTEVNLSGFGATNYRGYQLTQGGYSAAINPTVVVQERANLDLPGFSATLLVIQRGGDSFKNGFE